MCTRRLTDLGVGRKMGRGQIQGAPCVGGAVGAFLPARTVFVRHFRAHTLRYDCAAALNNFRAVTNTIAPIALSKLFVWATSTGRSPGVPFQALAIVALAAEGLFQTVSRRTGE